MMIAAGSSVPTCPSPQGPTHPPVHIVVLTRSAIVASTICAASAATLRNEITRARPASGDCLTHFSSAPGMRASRSAIAVVIAESATAIPDPPTFKQPQPTGCSMLLHSKQPGGNSPAELSQFRPQPRSKRSTHFAPMQPLLLAALISQVDCRIGGMLESPTASLPTGVSSLLTAPAAAASPSLVATLPSTDESRTVVDAGGALLPSTSRSRAVGDVVVALLPSAVWLRAVDVPH